MGYLVMMLLFLGIVWLILSNFKIMNDIKKGFINDDKKGLGKDDFNIK